MSSGRAERPGEFPIEVEQNAYQIGQQIKVMPERRVVHGITIGQRLKTLHDRAFQVRRDGSFFLLDAHYSDVANTIPIGSKVESEARKRVSTITLPNEEEIPMLPLSLSEGRLNLKPGQRTPTVSVSLVIDQNGQIHKFSSDLTAFDGEDDLTYQQADDALKYKSNQYAKEMEAQAALAKILFGKRRKRGALVGYDLDLSLSTGETGRMRRINPDNAYHSYFIKQELQSAVNEGATEYLEKNGKSGIYRVHHLVRNTHGRDDINDDLTEAFEANDPDSYNHAHGDNLGQAEYSATPSEHFALALPGIINFGSPLERFTDSVNQRILVATMSGTRNPYTHDELVTISRETNRKALTFRTTVSIPQTPIQAESPRRIARVEPGGRTKITEGDRRRVALAAEIVENGTANLKDLMESTAITSKDLMILLLENPTGIDEEKRAEVLNWLSNNPHVATTIINTGTQYYGWEKPEVILQKTTVDGRPAFRSTIKVTDNNQVSHQSSIQHSLSANTAKHFAAIDLLGRMIEIPVDLTDVIKADFARLPVQGIKQPKTTKEGFEQATRKERPVVKQPESYQDLYHMFCTERKWQEPQYTTEELEPETLEDGTELPHRYKVSVTTTSKKGTGYTLNNYGISAKSPEEAAEKAANYAVKSHFLYPAGYIPLKEVKFPEGDYLTAINGLRLKHSLPKPVFSHTVVAGENGIENHIMQIRQVGPTGRMIFKEVSAETEAAAKNEAAKQLYETLIAPPVFEKKETQSE